MKRLPVFIIAFTALCIVGCRSDADRMAEFCLHFDHTVQTASDCQEMAVQLEQMLDAPQPQLKNRDLCTTTTACLPCKSAVRTMLGQCGNDPSLKPVLEKMHFSKALQHDSEP